VQNAEYLYCPSDNAICGEQRLLMFDSDFGLNYDNLGDDEYFIETQAGFSTATVCWYKLDLGANWKAEIDINPEVLNGVTAEIYRSYTDGSFTFLTTLSEGQSEVLEMQQQTYLLMSSYYILVQANTDSSPEAKISIGVESDSGYVSSGYVALYTLLGLGGFCGLTCLGLLGVYLSCKIFNCKCRNRFNFFKTIKKKNKKKHNKSMEVPQASEESEANKV
jgi:hypothetical protein